MRRPRAAEAVIDCGEQHHTIRYERGRLVLVDHPGDRDADDVLVALSGQRARCREIEDAWHALTSERGVDLAGAPEHRLRDIARRLPVVLDQRSHTARRDDFAPEQRATMLDAFDQMAHLSRVASLGAPLANIRGELALRARRRPVSRAVRSWRSPAAATVRSAREGG